MWLAYLLPAESHIFASAASSLNVTRTKVPAFCHIDSPESGNTRVVQASGIIAWTLFHRVSWQNIESCGSTSLTARWGTRGLIRSLQGMDLLSDVRTPGTSVRVIVEGHLKMSPRRRANGTEGRLVADRWRCERHGKCVPSDCSSIETAHSRVPASRPHRRSHSSATDQLGQCSVSLTDDIILASGATSVSPGLRNMPRPEGPRRVSAFGPRVVSQA
jgi:hypothetical protein